eukprot:GFYU01039090.1.p1 GENE.GFYU01039090.1~~GFYU01039090.1.p1  ORF type:complete len:252 (+),score=11.92 GFYU01039090.1:89-844(+)
MNTPPPSSPTISTTLASRGSATAGAHGSGGGAAAPAGGNGNGGVDVASYVKHHRIHVLLDKLVKDLLTEKPADSAAWMLRWFVERHRLACEERHMKSSPQRGSGVGGGVDDRHQDTSSSSQHRHMVAGEKDETVQALEDALYSHSTFERGVSAVMGGMDHQISSIHGGGGGGYVDHDDEEHLSMGMAADGEDGAASHRSGHVSDVNGAVEIGNGTGGGRGGGGSGAAQSGADSPSLAGGKGDVLEQYLATR